MEGSTRSSASRCGGLSGREPQRWLSSSEALALRSRGLASLLPLGARRGAASEAGAEKAAEESGHAPKQPDGQPADPPWYVRWRSALIAAVALPAVGGFTYWVLYSPMLSIQEAATIDIKPINEEVFDKHDNLFVFFLDTPEELLERRDDIQRTIRKLMADKSLFRLRYYHNVKKEGDPPMPDANGGSGQEAPAGKKPMRVVMYKGQRKGFLNVGEEVPVQEVVEFFTLLTEERTAAMKQLDVPRVSGASFAADVVEKSSPQVPVLLQMYEDTCFLCFLMRPFVNSLAELLKAQKIPLVIKRLNIEKNDFPDGCPVARGTPTFVFFRGPGAPPEKWEEFKPKELVEKITQVFPQQTEEIFDTMDEFQGMVSKRFQLFTQLVMWTMELQKLERLIAEAPLNKEAAGDAESKEASAKEPELEDVAFNALVSEMMAKDMKRIDGIMENLAHLQKEVDEVEHDAALMGSMLGEAVLRREKAEEEQWAKRKSR